LGTFPNVKGRKIETWADNDSLAEHLQMDYILYCWKVWGDIENLDEQQRKAIELFLDTYDGKNKRIFLGS